MKENGIEGPGQCIMFENKAKMRKQNLNVVNRAKGDPLGFAKDVLRKIIVNEQDPRALPRIQDSQEAVYDYRKYRPGRDLAAGNLSRGEEWLKLQKDLYQYQGDFVSKASKDLIPDVDIIRPDLRPGWYQLSMDERIRTQNEYLRTLQELPNKRYQAGVQVKKIVGIPEPKGLLAKGFDKIASFFGRKPDKYYAEWVEKFIGTPGQPK